jgi:predicted DsbA family dithiol-disulfide isomerase
VSLANRMAVASSKVNARTIEASEFPDLSRRFGVQGVPRTVVNEEGAFVGALPEAQFVAAVLELAGVSPNGEEAGEEDGTGT